MEKDGWVQHIKMAQRTQKKETSNKIMGWIILKRKSEKERRKDWESKGNENGCDYYTLHQSK